MDAQVDVPNENEDATTTETMCPETHGDRPLTPPSLPIHHAAVHAAADALNENEDVTETQPAVNEPHATIRANSENTSEEQATEQATEQAAGKHVDRNYDSEEDDADFNPDDPLSEEEVELSSSSSSSSEDESEGLAIQQAKEAALMTETLTNARDLRDLEEAELFGEGKFTSSQLDDFRKLHILDGNPIPNLVHKRTVIKRMNQGRSVTKTTDRTGRVQGVRKYGGRAGLSNQTIVGKAFDSAVNNMEEGWEDSGNSQLKSGDYCAVIVQSKRGEGGSAPKCTYMVVGKFQRFGNDHLRHPLNLSWPIGGEKYCASVFVLGVKAYTSRSNEECLTPSGDIICTLGKVDASCILPISPYNEIIATEENGLLPVAIDVMKIKDLSNAFDILVQRYKHHVAKGGNIGPVQMGEKLYFVVGDNDPFSRSLELLVCTICDPPQYINRPKSKDVKPQFKDENELQRALRNHMAAHQLKSPQLMGNNEPCAFCCRSCHAVVQVARKNKKQIIDEKAAVLPKTKVLPNCQTYPSISPFTFKFLKAVKTYPSTNTLVFCEKCDDFIWSYNMKNHYNAMHPHVRPSDYDDYKPSEAEMKSIDALFPLNIPK